MLYDACYREITTFNYKYHFVLVSVSVCIFSLGSDHLICNRPCNVYTAVKINAKRENNHERERKRETERARQKGIMVVWDSNGDPRHEAQLLKDFSTLMSFFLSAKNTTCC